jgi:hypothetical protein
MNQEVEKIEKIEKTVRLYSGCIEGSVYRATLFRTRDMNAHSHEHQPLQYLALLSSSKRELRYCVAYEKECCRFEF